MLLLGTRNTPVKCSFVLNSNDLLTWNFKVIVITKQQAGDYKISLIRDNPVQNPVQ
jgi:hypothetical protein